MTRLLPAACLLSLCLALLALADGFHGAMNAEELSDQWNQNKYAAFIRGDSQGRLGSDVQNLLNHMKYLNKINVQPSEFPNFKDKDIPGVKSQAMAVLKEMGKAATPVVLNNLIQELERKGERRAEMMGMTPNEDYVFNLKMLLEEMGRDAVEDLRRAIERSTGSTKDELQRILDRILKKETDLQKDLKLKSDVELSGEIQKAIQKGLRVLLAEQGPNGSWAQHPGYTALGLLALLKAGVDPAKEEVQKAAAFVATAEPVRTYDVALTAMALEELDRRKYQPIIESCARWLERRQLANGMWDYRLASEGRISNVGQSAMDGDNSNTQFALLGLAAARKAGVRLEPTALERARRHFNDSQNTDGGWGYGSSRGQSVSYGSMTSVGVAGLFLLGNDLYTLTEKCGVYVENEKIARGLDWLGRSWSVLANPGAKNGGLAEPYYHLYSLERIGVLMGLKYIGGHDWYKEGAAFLVLDQKADGSWGRRIYGLSDTCMAILFLAKGPAPILLNKLRWEGKGVVHRFDGRHLVEAVEPALRQRLSYQVLDKGAPLSEYSKAPLLFINGHSAPAFTAAERETIRNFVRLGGIILAEACCSSAEFDKGFRQEMAAIFPDKRFVPLPAAHPAYSIRHAIRDPREMFLQGFVGCQTSVFYSPKGFTCAVDLGNDPADIGFRLGANVALYATGNRRLSDERQVEVRLAKDEAPPIDRVERGAFLLAQVKHDGDWNPDPHVVPNLLRHLQAEARLRVSFAKDAVTFGSPGLFDYSALFMTGHAAFTWTPEDAEKLRAYLQKGGILVAESCCGNKAFDRSFRDFAKAVFPDARLSVLPLDHRLYSFGKDPKAIKYRDVVLKENPDLQGPSVEGIAVDGHTVVFYSRFALGCAIEDHACVECRGYTRAGALDLITRLFLAGLTE